MAEVTRDEFERLDARVEVVEREVEGEKLVTRYILEQTRRNSDDLAAIKTRLARIEERMDGVEGRLGGVEQRLGSLERNLPRIVADTMREVLRERDGKQ
jgi:tetrahydromethanopterin S-methyltransferase subunit G